MGGAFLGAPISAKGCFRGQAVGWGRTRRHGPGVGLRGTGPALAGRRRKARVFALRARGLGCLPSMLAPARSRWRCWGAWGISASGDRLLGTGCGGSGDRLCWETVRAGCVRLQGTGCWGQAALWGRTRRHGPGAGLRGTGPALAGRRRKARVFALRARGLGCLPSMLAPARSRWRCWGVWGISASGDRLLGHFGGQAAGWGILGLHWEPAAGRHWGQAAGVERLLLGTGCGGSDPRPLFIRSG
jgi:hypothetical protein